jgi:type IV pilus assembly protein PilV
MRILNRTRGFTLLEVLIAVLVFSLGLLGVAGLMVVSVRTNHSAYLRTQASFLAESMADRMRGNVGHALDYNDDYEGSSATGDPGCEAAACPSADVVARDKEIWSRQLGEFLPNADASINCEGTQLGTGAQIGTAPFSGLCTMIIRWTEAGLDRPEDPTSRDQPATQTFAWVFQP